MIIGASGWGGWGVVLLEGVAQAMAVVRVDTLRGGSPGDRPMRDILVTASPGPAVVLTSPSVCSSWGC